MHHHCRRGSTQCRWLLLANLLGCGQLNRDRMSEDRSGRLPHEAQNVLCVVQAETRFDETEVAVADINGEFRLAVEVQEIRLVEFARDREEGQPGKLNVAG